MIRLYSILLLLMVSCGQENFLNIDIPSHIPAIATTAFISNGSELNLIVVSNTVSISYTLIVKPLENATVTIREVESGEELFFPYNPKYKGYTSNDGDFFRDNKTYELSVAEDDFPTVEAVQVFPSSINDFQVEFIPEDETHGSHTPNDLFTVQFDKDLESDFYFLSMTHNYRDSIFDLVFPKLYDPRLRFMYGAYPYPGFLIDGSLFQDSKIDLTFDDRLSLHSEGFFKIELHNITSDLFYFLESLHKNDQTAFNSLVEPVPVEFNVENGYGVFGLSNKVDTLIAL